MDEGYQKFIRFLKQCRVVLALYEEGEESKRGDVVVLTTDPVLSIVPRKLFTFDCGHGEGLAFFRDDKEAAQFIKDKLEKRGQNMPAIIALDNDHRHALKLMDYYIEKQGCKLAYLVKPGKNDWVVDILKPS